MFFLAIAYLAQYCFVFIIMYYLARRGREGFDCMQKGDFETFTAEDGFKYLRLTKKRKTKNYQRCDQDVKKGGSIPYEPNAFGVSPAQFCQDFEQLLDPKNKYLLQRPHRSLDMFTMKHGPW